MPNIWTDASGLVKAVAPVLASALGGPLAGVATSSILAALGLAPDAPPDAISAVLAAPTQDQLLALKKADHDFAATMKQLDVDFAKVDAGDRASARAREVSVHDSTPSVLAYGLSLGFFGLLALMVFHDVPAANSSAVNILLGALATGWVGAISYYFGSTSGSRTKDAMLFQSMPAPPAEQRPIQPAALAIDAK